MTNKNNSATRLNVRKKSLALALEPRMMFDAAAVATGVEIAAQADANLMAVQDHAPTVHAEPIQDQTYHVQKDSTVGGPVTLFQNAQASTNDAGQEFKDLVITVNSSGENQALIVDGKEVALVSGKGVTDNKHYAYSIVTSGGTTTITIAIDASDYASGSDVQALINGMQYKVRDSSVDSGTVTVSLSKVSDTGENNHTSDLNITTTVHIENGINRAPEISSDKDMGIVESISIPGFGNVQAVAYSNDGKHAYVVSSSGSVGVFSVDGNGKLTQIQAEKDFLKSSGTVKNVVMTADGTGMYVAIGGSSNGSIVALSVGGDGKLTFVSTRSIGGGVSDLSIDADGKKLYVGGGYGGLITYDRDAKTNELSAYREVNSGVRAPYFTSNDRFVYVFSEGLFFEPSLVRAYTRNADGGLGQVVEIDAGFKNTSGSGIYGMTSSKNGEFLFIADNEGGKIHIYQQKSDGGAISLKLFDSSTLLSGVKTLTLSQDGSKLYAVGGNDKLTIYAVNSTTGALSKLTEMQVAGANDIAVSADGKGILVTGDVLNRLSNVRNYIYGSDMAIGEGLTISDKNLDRLAGGQGNYNGASVTISRTEGASTADKFGFTNTNDYEMKDGEISYQGKVVAKFNTNTAGQLHIQFSADVTTAQVNGILRSVTYNYAGTGVVGVTENIMLEVSVSDGELSSAENLKINLVASANIAPEIGVTPVDNGKYIDSKKEITLFSDASLNLGEIGQKVLSVTFTIDSKGLPFANEKIRLDGIWIDLAESTSGTTANGYSYSYTLANGVATLTLNAAVSGAGLTLSAAQNVINNITYVNEKTDYTKGVREVTITSLQDDGGTDNGGKDTAHPDIKAIIDLEISNAPTISIGSDVDPLLYYTNGSLSGYADYVTDLVVSKDGKTLIISGSEKGNAAGKNYVRVYARDASTGALALLQTFTQGVSDDPLTPETEVNGLNTVTTMALSADGNMLYLAGFASGDSDAKYSLVLFTRDATSGKLAYKGIVATQGENNVSGLDAMISQIVVSEDGKNVYTINGVRPNDTSIKDKGAVTFFSRNADTGDLTFIGSYAGKTETSSGVTGISLRNPTGMVISPDGKSVYIANDSNRITVLARNTDTGELTYSAFISRDVIAQDPEQKAKESGDTRYMENLQDIVISKDGKFVYVSNNTIGMLSIFSRDESGKLTYAGSFSASRLANSNMLREIALSPDENNAALYVTTFSGQSILIFKRHSETGQLEYSGKIDGLGRNANHFVVSPDGKNIYSGVSVFKPGVNIISAQPNALYQGQGDTGFAGKIHIQDIDMDGLNNYKGASLVIERSSGASATDMFGFSAGNSLTISDGKIMEGGKELATLTVVGGKMTLVFTGDVTKDRANQIIQQLTYKNSGTPERVSLRITVSDGAKSDSQMLMLIRDPSVITVDSNYQVPGGATENQYTVVLPANLFTSPAGKSLTWRVDGLPAGLTFDAASRTIAGVPSTAGVYTLKVTVEDGDGKTAFVDLQIDVSVNQAPVITMPGDIKVDVITALTTIPDVGTIDSVVLSSDGRHVYAADTNGAIAVLERDVFTGEMKHIKTLVYADTGVSTNAKGLYLSADGKTLYLKSDYEGLVVFSVSENGGLNFVERHDIKSVQGIEVSADGKTAYVVSNQWGGTAITVYTRDTNTGALTKIGEKLSSDTDGEYTISPSALAISGDYLFISNSDYFYSGVMVFQHDGKGNLTQVAGVKGEGAFDFPSSIALSSDGKQVYVGASGAVAAYAFDKASNTFTKIGVVSNAGSVTALSLSADQKNLYVSHDYGKLSVYDVSAKGIALAGAVVQKDGSALGDVQGAVSFVDGSALVFGRGLTLYKRSSDIYVVGGAPVVLVPEISMSDFDRDNVGNGNYKGISVTVARDGGLDAHDVFSFKDSGAFKLEASTMTFNGNAIATLTSENGKLVLVFTADVSRDTANSVLRQLTYAYAGESATGTVRLNIVVNDGAANSDPFSVELLMSNAPKVNDKVTMTSPVLIGGRQTDIVFPEDLFIDADNDILAWSVTGYPDGMSFDAKTRTLSGQPSSTGSYTLTITVTDPAGNKATHTLSLDVKANIAPEAGPGVIELNPVTVGDTVTYTVPADAFIDANNDTLTITATGLPPGMAFDSKTNVLSGAPSGAGAYTVVLTATDPSGASVIRSVTFNVANIAPEVSGKPTHPTFTEKGPSVPLFGNVQIDVHGASETVAELVFALDGMTDGAHEQLTIDGATLSLVAGSTGSTTGGHRYTVSMEGGVLTLRLVVSADLPVQDAQALLNDITYRNGSDNPGVQSRTVTLVSLRDSGGVAGGGSDTVQVNITSSITLIPVNDAPRPIVSEIYAPLVESDQAYVYQLPASLFIDPEGDDFVVTLDVSGLPPGLQYDAHSGRISGTIAEGNAGTYRVVVTARDTAGAQASLTLVLRVQDQVNATALLPDATTVLPPSDNMAALMPPLAAPAPLAFSADLETTTPLSTAPVTMGGMFAHPGLRGMPSYMTDVLQQPWESGGNDRPVSLLARPAGMHGRYVYALPEQLSASRSFSQFVLRQADGSALPRGIYLDVRTGNITAEGVRGTWHLVVMSRAADGTLVRTPVTVTVPDAVAEGQGKETGKRSMTEQLRGQSTQQIEQEVQALLEMLAVQLPAQDTPETQAKDNHPSLVQVQ